jgi:vacuolar fusion protein MON1
MKKVLSFPKFTVFPFVTCSVRIQNVLAKSNVLSEIQRSMLESGLRIEDLPSEPTRLPIERTNAESASPQGHISGPAGLCHFMYKSVYLNQFVSSDFSAPLKNPNQQKR